MTAIDRPDLAAVRARHKAFEDAWDHEYMAPDGPAKAAASAQDVPALLAELDRYRSLLDVAVRWRAQFEGSSHVRWPRRQALIDAIDQITGGLT